MRNNKEIALIALFTAFAVILSYIETFIPPIGIPGVKLGLANFCIILVLYLMGAKQALIVNIIRIIILGMFYGNLFSICFSIAGALVSFVSMYIAKRTQKISIITVAILGGIFHNIGQIVVASLIVKTYGVVSYIPILIIAGILTGMIIGILSNVVYRRIKNDFIHFRNN